MARICNIYLCVSYQVYKYQSYRKEVPKTASLNRISFPQSESIDIALKHKSNFQDKVDLYGIKNVKIYAREILSTPEGKLSFSTPNQPDVYKSPAGTGKPGNNGKDGLDGPKGKSLTI